MPMTTSPYDASETSDQDLDGVGDNADVYVEHFIYNNGKIGRWNTLAAWDDVMDAHYNTSVEGRDVTWQEQSTSDPAHERVISVSFNNDSSGGFYIIAYDSPFDFSSYAGGAITFDIRPLSYGSSTSDLEVLIHCVWPCTSANYAIGRPPAKQWSNIRVPLSELGSGRPVPQHCQHGLADTSCVGRPAGRGIPAR